MEETTLLTFSELAEMLRVSRSTAHRMLRDEKLPVWILVGRRRRWRREDVEAWLREREGAVG